MTITFGRMPGVDCTATAVKVVEGYSPRETAHGSLDATVYVCEDHHEVCRKEWLPNLGMTTPYTLQQPPLHPQRCGYMVDYRDADAAADEATADVSMPRDPVELEEKLAAEALDEGEGPPCGVCGWPAAAHMATADTHNFVVSEFTEDRAAKGCTHPPDEPCFGKRSPMDEVLEGVRERARNLPTVEVTREAIYPMSYRLTVNGQKHEPYGTFREVRAAVADLVTRRLAAEPRVAEEAQAMNALFQAKGVVQEALDERAEWYTVFDAYGEEPLRIRITVERD